MKTVVLLQKLSGIQTIESVMDALHVSKARAVYYVHRLRTEGYVKTKHTKSKKRVYSISWEHRLGGTSYYDILNEHSPVKVVAPEKHFVYGKVLTVEETIVFALKSGSVRTILSALALFKDVSDWSLLYALAKKEGLRRQVGALYDVARSVLRVRRMTKRFRTNALPSKKDSYEDILPSLNSLHSRDFRSIEAVWKVRIPLNILDLEDYR